MRRHALFAACAAAALATASLPAAADGPFARATAVADAELDRMRGGYVDTRGLTASFGFERTTFVNGQLVVSQSIRIADLSRVTAADALALRSVVGAANVVQNTRNDQTIRNVTVLDATTNSLGMLQRISAGAALRDALIAPLVRP